MENQPILYSIAILDARTILQGIKKQKQLLIQWGGASPEDSTWENIESLKETWPNINLEDKVSLEGKEDDTWPIGTIFTGEEVVTFIKGMLKAGDETMEEGFGFTEVKEANLAQLTQTSKRVSVVPRWTRDFDLSGPKWNRIKNWEKCKLPNRLVIYPTDLCLLNFPKLTLE